PARGKALRPCLGHHLSQEPGAANDLVIAAPLDPHYHSAPRPSLSQRPSTHVNGHHSSATESRLTAVNTTEAPSTAAAPSKGIRDAETARSQRQCSTRLILRFGLMSSILGGGLGLGFLLAGGAVPHAVAGSAVPMLAVLLASTVSSIAGFAFSALC